MNTNGAFHVGNALDTRCKLNAHVFLNVSCRSSYVLRSETNLKKSFQNSHQEAFQKIALLGKIVSRLTKREKQPPEVLYKKGVLKNFTKLTGKYLCQCLFLIKLQAWDRLLKRRLWGEDLFVKLEAYISERHWNG